MVNEEAYILFVRKNAIVVLIPKFGLEGTVFFEEKDKPKPSLNYNPEVCYSGVVLDFDSVIWHNDFHICVVVGYRGYCRGFL